MDFRFTSRLRNRTQEFAATCFAVLPPSFRSGAPCKTSVLRFLCKMDHRSVLHRMLLNYPMFA